MKRKYKRLTFVILGVALIAVAVGLMLNAFQSSIVFFRSPTDVADGVVKGSERFRLGGLVEKGSVVAGTDGQVSFVVTDLQNSVHVSYKGILPDLFREGQGVVTEGRIVDGVFQADEVLAKHDEKYMPPEVAAALKKSGRWKEGQGGNPVPGASQEQTTQ